jgi:uncharacterized repeat protein (TIGR03809 family)
MANREVPLVPARIAQMPPAMMRASVNWQKISLKWRDLAERRKAHFVELYETGRWKHYYTDIEFLAELRKAIAAANRWAKLAPRPEDDGEAAGAPLPPPLLKALPPAA